MPVEPRNAAACILIRGDDEPEVLLARRNDSLRFMAGHYVFPGGSVDQNEKVAHVVGADDASHAVTVHAAVREVFEESGLLCVKGDLPGDEARRDARHALLANQISFDEILERYQLTIDAREFEPAGLWVTPEFSKIRFATHYFLHRIRGDHDEDLVEGEIVHLRWFTAKAARRLWHRGEIRISTPIAYVLQQLAATTVPNALDMLRRGTGRPPGEHNRFEIRRGITLVPLRSQTLPPATHTNCIIVGEERMFVIDPGAEDPVELEHLGRQLDHLIELGGSIAAIILSHSHPDHVAGTEFVRQRYNVPVFAHPLTEEQVRFRIDRHILDDELITSPGEPEWRLRAIHTPGHDPGHLCFLEESTGALLVGDMMANPGSIIVSRAFRGDMAEFMSSLERLLEYPSKIIVPSHGFPEGSPHEQIKKQIAHRQWREDQVREAYESGARTVDELLAKAYADVPQSVWPMARHSLDAHLHKLGIDVEVTL